MGNTCAVAVFIAGFLISAWTGHIVAGSVFGIPLLLLAVVYIIGWALIIVGVMLRAALAVVAVPFVLVTWTMDVLFQPDYVTVNDPLWDRLRSLMTDIPHRA
jgi:hypothetical protein